MRTRIALGLALALAAVAMPTPAHAKEATVNPVVSSTSYDPTGDVALQNPLKTLDAIEASLVSNVFGIQRTADALGYLIVGTDAKEQRTSPEVLDVADGPTSRSASPEVLDVADGPTSRSASSIDRVSAFNLDHLSVAFVSNPSGGRHVSVLERSGKSATSPKVKVHKRRQLSVSIDNRYRGVDHEICSQGVLNHFV